MEIIGIAKLKETELVRKSKNLQKNSIIKRSEIEEKEQSKSQEDLYNEEVYTLRLTAEDNKIMQNFIQLVEKN